MPLTLLRGPHDRSRAPAVPPGADDGALTDAYLKYFQREARWPGRKAETDLAGLDVGIGAERSLKTAVRAASIYLASWDADITIYVPEDRRPGPDLESELTEYIAKRYTGGGGLFGVAYSRAPRPASPPPEMPGRTADAFISAHVTAAPPVHAARSVPPRPARKAASLEEMLSRTDAGFSETLLKLIDESGRRDADVYKAANIDRKLFSKIRSNPRYRPSKSTALALAFALRLDLDGTRDLIGRAGYTLTHASCADIIVEYFIQCGNYDIFQLNETLFRYDQPLLGGA